MKIKYCSTQFANEHIIYTRYSTTCYTIGYGYTSSGETYSYKQNNDIKYCQLSTPSYNKWHKFKINVDKEKNVNIFINEILIGKFKSHFGTRGHGGPMLLNRYNGKDHQVQYRAKFRHFKIKGKPST